MSLRVFRRAEAATLIVLAYLVTFRTAEATMVVLDVPLLATAAAVLPKSWRERSRFYSASGISIIEDLFRDACNLRLRYSEAVSAGRLELGGFTPIEIGREVERWVHEARTRMNALPEFRVIFDSHGGTTLLSELEGRISRLDEIHRLLEASTRLGIKI